MKPHKYSIFLTLAALLLICPACQDDDVSDFSKGQTIQVIRQDLLFDSQSRTGFIELQTPSPINASVSSDWCSARVEGQTVYVSVEANDQFEGRTAILTITTAEDELTVPVQQRGLVVASLEINAYRADNNGETKTFYMRHDLPVELSTTQDWIETEMHGDSLFIKVQPNTSRGIRRGTVNLQCGEYSDYLDIVQYDLQNHILGQYFLGGYSDGNPVGLRFRIIQQGGQLYTDWRDHERWDDAILPADFDETTCTLTMYSAMNFFSDSNGDSDTGYFFDQDGAIALSSSVSVQAQFYQDPLFNTTYAAIADNGSWPGHSIQGFTVYMSRLAGILNQTAATMTDLYLIRIGF